jgi:hypothetical protein
VACQIFEGKQWQLALHVMAVLEQSRLAADDISCNAAISACAKGHLTPIDSTLRLPGWTKTATDLENLGKVLAAC